jgi:hypothetical protein
MKSQNSKFKTQTDTDRYTDEHGQSRRRSSLNARQSVFGAVVAALVLLPGLANACDVPVFRYALEEWVADYYEAVLIQPGADTARQADPNSLLQSQGRAADLVNVHFSTVNLGSSTPEQVKKLLGGEVPKKLPALALWYPMHRGRTPPFWVGEFKPDMIPALIQSPKRKELATRLTKGDSAVWVLVESGNASKDKAALKVLNDELKKATPMLKQEMAPLLDASQTPGLKIKFSTLSISRSDPNERFLVASLLNSEPDLQKYADEPILFPVFGRGRALYALVGKGINVDNIDEALGFLTGPCSCQIKMWNPGVDLPMAVDWDAAVAQFYQEFDEPQQAQMQLTSAFPDASADANAGTAAAATTAQAPADTNSSAPTANVVQAPADANGSAQNATLESNLTSAVSDLPSTPSIKVRTSGRKSRGFGILGTAAISLGGVVLVVALGTLAVTRRRKEQP